MVRILGVDYGRRRIGIAVSDELGLTAQGMPTLQAGGRAEAIAVVAEAASRLQVGEIVVGLPLNMDGSRGPMAEAAEAFARGLEEATGLPVCCWDERLTSRSAHRAMQEMGQRSRGQKGRVDRIAATLLLDTYLKARKGHNGEAEIP
jgi:putative Holliday junction resolvase